MIRTYRNLRRCNGHTNRLRWKPLIEDLEARSLMVIGFPIGFIGPLPTDGYYDPSLTLAQHPKAQATSVGAAIPADTPVTAPIYSNYDAPALFDVLAGQVTLAYTTSATYSTDIGQLKSIIPDSSGIQAPLSSSVTITNTVSLNPPALDDILVVVPPNFQGTITITETVSDPTPMSQSYLVPVVPYDDGSYEASIQDQKTLGLDDGSPPTNRTDRDLIGYAVS